MKKVYIRFSNSTSVTGRNLIEGLTTYFEDTDNILIDGGKEMPGEDTDILISYGAGAREGTALPETIFNNPVSIRGNVNKFKALKTMKESEVRVANFEKVSDLTEEKLDNFVYPAILRTNQHHAGRGLSVCLCKGQVKKLLERNANEFGHIMELKAFDTEYRLHVCNGEIIKAARKAIQRDPMESWKVNYSEKIEKVLERREVEIESVADTVNLCLDTVVADLTLPDLLVKSNKHGWCFKGVRLENINEELKENAIKAVKAIGLDFGAVDCALDFEGNAYVIEVNTGPGLQGNTLDAYLASFSKYIEEQVTPEVIEDTDDAISNIVGQYINLTHNESSVNPSQTTEIENIDVASVIGQHLGTVQPSIQTEMSAILEGIQQLNTKMLELQARM